jgi:hypothetical protein
MTIDARGAFRGSHPSAVDGIIASCLAITANITSTGTRLRCRVIKTATGVFARNQRLQQVIETQLMPALNDAADEMLEAAEAGVQCPVPEAIVRRGAEACPPRPPAASDVGSGTPAELALAGVTALVNYLKDASSYSGKASPAKGKSYVFDFHLMTCFCRLGDCAVDTIA